jgi:L-fuconolactonase
MVVDNHTHVVSPDTSRFPRRPGHGDRAWWTDGDQGLPALLSEMDAAGVERAVIVQAVGPYGHDCRCAIAAVADCPERLRLVGSIDMSGPDPAGALRDLAATAPLHGVRLFGVDGNRPDWLSDGRADAVWAAAAELRCTVVATLFAADLASLRPLVETHPTVPVAVDHAGFPELGGTRPLPGLPHVLALADLEAVNVKISSHLLLAARRVGDPADLVDRLVAAFGADRLSWGSDFPQTRGLAYLDMVALARHAARRLAPPDADALFAVTARRLWFDPP